MTTTTTECQQLKLGNDLFTSVRAGDKCVACYKGRRDIQLGDLLFISTDAVERDGQWDIYYEDQGQFYLAELVEVDRVTFTRAGDLLKEEVQEIGFESRQELITSMQRSYPDFDCDTEVTFIYFEIK